MSVCCFSLVGKQVTFCKLSVFLPTFTNEEVSELTIAPIVVIDERKRDISASVTSANFKTLCLAKGSFRRFAT